MSEFLSLIFFMHFGPSCGFSQAQNRDLTLNKIVVQPFDDALKSQHTWIHINVNIVYNLTLSKEIPNIDNKCHSLRIHKPLCFAYPGYITDSTKLEPMKQLNYLTARTGGSRPYVPGEIILYLSRASSLAITLEVLLMLSTNQIPVSWLYQQLMACLTIRILGKHLCIKV